MDTSIAALPPIRTAAAGDWPVIMVHLDLGSPNTALLWTARMLGERFGATIIGIAACEPIQLDYSSDYVPINLIEQDQAAMADAVSAAEAAFRSALRELPGKVEWRSRTAFAILVDYVADQARCADLVVMTASSDGAFGGSRRISAGDLVIGCGRPVLVLPPDAVARRLQRVMVAWKDTRESRRAIVDALPLLRAAAHVGLVELTKSAGLDEARSRLTDVATWLSRHSVAASVTIVPARDDDAAQLLAIAREQDADVIVAGAYGHSRLREWALGGVTRDLLAQQECSVLLSH